MFFVLIKFLTQTNHFSKAIALGRWLIFKIVLIFSLSIYVFVHVQVSE